MAGKNCFFDWNDYNPFTGPQVTDHYFAITSAARDLLDDTDAATMRATLGVAPLYGWLTDTNTWTYASGSSFTIAADATSYLQAGLKIKCTNNSTTVYGVIASVSYSSPNTTVTLITTSDYTIANSAITNPSYSYDDNPMGCPTWFNYTPTYGGYSSNPTGPVYQWSTAGRAITVKGRDVGAGTSNATTASFSLPVAAVTLTNAIWDGTAEVVDNGTTQSAPALCRVSSAGTTASLQRDYTPTAFTNSGSKRAIVASVTYPF